MVLVVGAVDLERARPHAAVADLVTLACGSWVGRPDLQHAFFEGYAVRSPPKSSGRCAACLCWMRRAPSRGGPNGDDEIVACGRATLARLEVQAA
ncbi:hypothetical protein [Streptomyces akebiae]|uniref:Uncharacterized protein n=1 Tax=Streptomyces akebiae TaxID=2865673 RepID=A0ABX8XGT0_9ACTN|nr:hypothetical protein [Streptomyces akebiae]QYX75143.1 hypothetical protein K1J60_00200 [Streptomyces akebiae]